MTGRRAVVVGIGNEYRHDDGIGPRVAETLARLALPEVVVTVCDGEPTDLIDIWTGADLAVVVDAALCRPSHPGRIHRTTVESLSSVAATSSHALGLRDAITLAGQLGRLPGELVVIIVEAARMDLGIGLSPSVASAVPEVVDTVLDFLGARVRHHPAVSADRDDGSGLSRS
ncbi:hydrogenase maturation protease [Nocardia sp. CA2R105]|uniref:hydrogenase maturation protease n=1 Tax=Nocardia coffeae TaxID=2873381 RepID=UPI001CA6F8CB|nr:hydrogenase maturation protease [Nocardia coffeae]MBY8857411.1 hydrogenase maturation protease [Nocardia coffeae]